jgi:hypothetical protein
MVSSRDSQAWSTHTPGSMQKGQGVTQNVKFYWNFLMWEYANTKIWRIAGFK